MTFSAVRASARLIFRRLSSLGILKQSFSLGVENCSKLAFCTALVQSFELLYCALVQSFVDSNRVFLTLSPMAAAGYILVFNG